MPKIDLQEATYTLGAPVTAAFDALAGVVEAARIKARSRRGRSVVTCQTNSPSTGWTCTAPLGHPDYIPHIAAGGGSVFAIWYSPATLDSYGVTLSKSGDPRRIEIQGEFYTGPGGSFDLIPDVTYKLRDRDGTDMCNAISKGETYTCTLPKGHVDYCPHLAGTSYRIIALWYDSKTLKRYGKLAQGDRYPERTV